MKITLFNNTKYKISKRIIRSIKTQFDLFKNNSKNKKINLIIYTPKEITTLNNKIFKRNTATDVISIHNPASETDLGDVYICPAVIYSNASIYKEDKNIELTRIIIHGILHLLGYNHTKPFPDKDSKMFTTQEDILKKVVNLTN